MEPAGGMDGERLNVQAVEQEKLRGDGPVAPVTGKLPKIC